MPRILIGVLLLALAFGGGVIALRATQRRKRVMMGGLTLLLLLAAVGAIWWPFAGAPAPLPGSARLYVGTQDALVALRASDGAVVWSFTAKGNKQSPAVAHGVAYYATPDATYKSGVVYAVNAASGALLWQRKLDGRMVHSTPAIGDGAIYVTNERGVYALNASDGAQLWHAALDSSTNPSSPTLAGGMLYFGAGWDDRAGATSTPACLCVYALRVSDGTVAWTAPTGRIFDAPAVVDGVVYDGDFEDGMFALRASDGKRLWSKKGMNGSGSPVVVDGVIYVSGFDNLIHALSARDGSPIWQTPGLTPGPPFVSDGVVYVGVTGQVLALRASDGKPLWRSGAQNDKRIYSTVYVTQGVIFVTASCGDSFSFFPPCQDQTLALSARDGSVYWSKTLRNPSDPAFERA
jgi:outer membrane protein assembly factor BamB